MHLRAKRSWRIRSPRRIPQCFHGNWIKRSAFQESNSFLPSLAVPVNGSGSLDLRWMRLVAKIKLKTQGPRDFA